MAVENNIITAVKKMLQTGAGNSQVPKFLAPLFNKVAKKRSAKTQLAKEQPVGTMQSGYEAASRNTTLLS